MVKRRNVDDVRRNYAAQGNADRSARVFLVPPTSSRALFEMDSGSWSGMFEFQFPWFSVYGTSCDEYRYSLASSVATESEA